MVRAADTVKPAHEQPVCASRAVGDNEAGTTVAGQTGHKVIFMARVHLTLTFLPGPSSMQVGSPSTTRILVR